MAFKKLVNCDSSDVALWANGIVAREFEKEIDGHREKSLRALIKKPTEENAAEVRAYDKVKSLLEEARRMG